MRPSPRIRLSFFSADSSRALLLLTALGLLGGCADIIGIQETSVRVTSDEEEAGAVCGDGERQGDEQCDEGVEATGMGGAAVGTFCSSDCTWAAGHDFSCLEESSMDASGNLELSFAIIDLNSQEPLEGATVTICGAFDRSCSQVDEDDILTTDADGFASKSVPAPFAGSVMISAEGFVHLHKFRAQPIYSDSTIGAEMLATPLFEGLAGAIAGSPPDPALGHMTAEVQDCLGAPSGEFAVSVSNPDGASFAYLDPGGFNTSLSETTFIGRWAGINLPTGRQDITAARADGVSVDGTVEARGALENGDASVAVVSNILLAPNHLEAVDATTE